MRVERSQGGRQRYGVDSPAAVVAAAGEGVQGGSGGEAAEGEVQGAQGHCSAEADLPLCPVRAMHSLAGGGAPMCCPPPERRWADGANPFRICSADLTWCSRQDDTAQLAALKLSAATAAAPGSPPPHQLAGERPCAEGQLLQTVLVALGTASGYVIVLLFDPCVGGLSVRRHTCLRFGRLPVVHVAVRAASESSEERHSVEAVCKDGSLHSQIIDWKP